MSGFRFSGLRILFALSVALVCVLPYFQPAHAAASPESSIPQLQKAIDTGDTALLEQYMDINAVTASATAAVIADPSAVKAAGDVPAVALLLAGMGADPRAKAAIQGMLATEAKNFVTYGVASGAFAGKPKPTSASPGLLEPLLRGGAKDAKRFGKATVRQRGESVALVSTSLYDASSAQEYPLELRLTPQKGVWRVTEITNMPALIQLATAGRK